MRRLIPQRCLAFAVWLACALPCAAQAQIGSHPGPLPPQEPKPLVGSYHYDDAGRLVRAVFTDQTTIDYTYDLSGNLVRIQTTSVPTQPLGIEGPGGGAPGTDAAQPSGRGSGPTRGWSALSLLGLVGAVVASSTWRARSAAAVRAAVLDWLRAGRPARSGPADGDQHEPARGSA